MTHFDYFKTDKLESIEQTTITNRSGVMIQRSKHIKKSSRNITLMVMFQCVLYTFG
jgi:hypothetical protein